MVQKSKKANLLSDLQKGKITLKEFRTQIAQLNGEQVQIVLYVEISPGVFQNEDTGEILTEGQKPEYMRPMDIAVFIHKFNADGTPCPDLHFSEKDVVTDMELNDSIPLFIDGADGVI